MVRYVCCFAVLDDKDSKVFTAGSIVTVNVDLKRNRMGVGANLQ